MEPWSALFAGMFGPAVEAARERLTPPADALPAAPLKAYVGRYANAYVGAAQVRVAGEGLELRLGPDGQARFPLTHVSRDLFSFIPAAELPDMPSAVSFALGGGREGGGGDDRGPRRLRAGDTGAGGTGVRGAAMCVLSPWLPCPVAIRHPYPPSWPGLTVFSRMVGIRPKYDPGSRIGAALDTVRRSTAKPTDYSRLIGQSSLSSRSHYQGY
ncbi:DUF3471 domain-containing protein [Ancylobacter dichloromethanicus]